MGALTNIIFLVVLICCFAGFFVAGALNSGKVFIWNKKSGTVKLTAVLDKIRNVQPGTSEWREIPTYLSFHFLLKYVFLKCYICQLST